MTKVAKNSAVLTRINDRLDTKEIFLHTLANVTIWKLNSPHEIGAETHLLRRNFHRRPPRFGSEKSVFLVIDVRFGPQSER